MRATGTAGCAEPKAGGASSGAGGQRVVSAARCAFSTAFGGAVLPEVAAVLTAYLRPGPRGRPRAPGGRQLVVAGAPELFLRGWKQIFEGREDGPPEAWELFETVPAEDGDESAEPRPVLCEPFSSVGDPMLRKVGNRLFMLAGGPYLRVADWSSTLGWRWRDGWIDIYSCRRYSRRLVLVESTARSLIGLRDNLGSLALEYRRVHVPLTARATCDAWVPMSMLPVPAFLREPCGASVVAFWDRRDPSRPDDSAFCWRVDGDACVLLRLDLQSAVVHAVRACDEPPSDAISIPGTSTVLNLTPRGIAAVDVDHPHTSEQWIHSVTSRHSVECWSFTLDENARCAVVDFYDACEIAVVALPSGLFAAPQCDPACACAAPRVAAPAAS